MSNQQKLSRSERARFVNMLVGEGAATRQIAEVLGISHGRVAQLCRQHGIPLATSGTQRFATSTPRRRGKVLMELADGAGVPPSVMLNRIVGLVVDDGPDIARRRLGKLALPPRHRSEPP